MKQLQYTISDPNGIHARPAGLLVKQMQSFPCDITIAKGEKSADCKKLFAVMKLAVKQGETITITAEGEQEELVIEAAAKMLQAAEL